MDTIRLKRICIAAFVILSLATFPVKSQPLVKGLVLNEKEYFETRGLNVLVFSNWYNGLFSDSKISGIELIHHEVRTATNGDVRLSATPEQWDPIPTFVERKVDKEKGTIVASLKYPNFNFSYRVVVSTVENEVRISVETDQPLPLALEGKAGFNLEFLPSAYFEKSFLMDNQAGTFPLYPTGPMTLLSGGITEPLPLAKGKSITLAPEDPEHRVNIVANQGELALYDGRNKAQNGWFVVRTLIPSGKSGKVIDWTLTANTIPNWTRKPMIAFSQVGYHPAQEKVAVVELDRNDKTIYTAKLLKIDSKGNSKVVAEKPLERWGQYLRYNYGKFNFSEVKEDGLYQIVCGEVVTPSFRIAKDVYANTWHPSLDVFLNVEMCHVLVNEAYRVWHGASHLDDARQAPVNHEHFDLYAQGPTTDTKYQPGEHIPGLDIGGWYDAGDFDIRTQTNYAVVMTLVNAWETFKIDRDETTIDQAARYVDMHHPDGKPDILQQIEHGALGLIAQHRSCGHAIPGIIVPDISQYTHLGDGLTETDGKIYDPKMGLLESDGIHSGVPDDRWAFTSKSTPLNYGSIAGLAAASRALKGFNDALANECISTAIKAWDEEQTHKPDIFYVGNTTGGPLENEALKAAVELLITTKSPKYATRVSELMNQLEKQFGRYATLFVRAMPYMDNEFSKRVRAQVEVMAKAISQTKEVNPFGVTISEGGWAGSGGVMNAAISNYILHKAFPDLISADLTLKGANYIYGCHPAHNLSLVSGVGTASKKVAYGNNRADFTFIAGGVVPGILILQPDFPENKEDWPFFWGENEYVVDCAASHIFLANAVNELLNGK